MLIDSVHQHARGIPLEHPDSGEIIQITVLDAGGIMVYHKSFIGRGVNEHLFSAFTAAILAFARELGSKLTAISFEDVTFYMQTRSHYTVVLGVASPIQDPFAELVLEMIQESQPFKELEELSEYGADGDTSELELYVTQMLTDQDEARKFIERPADSPQPPLPPTIKEEAASEEKGLEEELAELRRRFSDQV